LPGRWWQVTLSARTFCHSYTSANQHTNDHFNSNTIPNTHDRTHCYCDINPYPSLYNSQSWQRCRSDSAIFDQQMKWLSDNNYKTISITQLATLILNGGELPLRPVVITFDDGNKDIYQNAYPILQKYNFIATFYIVIQYINGENMITADQLQELISQGWEIGSHSDHHSDLTSENADLDTEVRLAKIALEKKLGVKIYTFAYPFGTANEAVVNKVYKAGFTSAAGLGESITHGRNNIYYLNRIEIQNEYSMEKFIQLMPWSGPLQ
jgi:peptidoglycan/xylan/chitin deacetylase (PgdA/CDA1 family)